MKNVFLEKTAPNKVGEEWEVSVIATVKEGKKLIAGEQVFFYLGSQQIDSPELTDGGGRAYKDLVLPRGSHTVFARLQDGTSARITIYLKEEKPPKQVKKIVSQEVEISRGKYVLTFQALADGMKEERDYFGVQVCNLNPQFVIHEIFGSGYPTGHRQT